MKLLFTLAAMLTLWAAPTFARIGETESQLIKRFGRPTSSLSHYATANGVKFEVGSSLTFVLGDWTITCDLIGGQCARIAYSKIGAWEEENFQTLLTANAQGEKWADLLPPSVKQLSRKWKRDDGIVADWVLGSFTVSSPLYLERSKAIAEEKAKAAEKLAQDVAVF